MAEQVDTAQAIAVLGAGSWGTALALVLAGKGRPVRLWGHDPAHTGTLARERENRRHLPGAAFPENLSVSSDLARTVEGVHDLLIVVPSHAFRNLMQSLSGLVVPEVRVLWATKGLDAESGGLLHRIVEKHLPGRPMGLLSGPSFAREVVRDLPTAVTIASPDAGFAREMAEAFHTGSFRPYTSSDLIGVELGGAVKNVLAVATGIADGLGLGANTRAGLITRGLAELGRLGESMNADPRTFMGLSGVGDLILTCTDDQSRNRRLGLALGRGISLDAALKQIGQTVEGVRTAAEVHALSATRGVEMPISAQVHAVLHEGRLPQEALGQLLARSLKDEFE